MSVFSVRGFTVATAASADDVIAQLWNPDSLKSIRVIEMGLFKAGAGTANDSIYVDRSSARGTQSVTVTPDADNAWEADDVPASGALLDVDFSAEPTLKGNPMFGWVAAAVAASGFIWPTPRGIRVPAGTGLCICQRAATAWPTSEAYFVWEE